jgi:Uroporphyrinogen-III methylase
VLFTTFSRGDTAPLVDDGLNWAAITPETTIAIYMPGIRYGEVAARLVENGLAPETPCVVVSQATRPEQQVCWTNVAALAGQQHLPAPAILLVGKIAAQHFQQMSIGVRPQMLAAEQAALAGSDVQKKN